MSAEAPDWSHPPTTGPKIGSFHKLAVSMVGFGILTGLAFPPFAGAIVVDASEQVATTEFRAACLVAGILVGGLNYLLVRAVVGRRLRRLAARMHDVVEIVRTATATGDWSQLQLSRCQLPVDTDDELGEPAAAFNALIGALDHNVRERRNLEDRLRHQALHDPLTGLANRDLLLDRVEHGLARVRRNRSQLAIFYIDLDGFKAINDTWGHAFGDDLLAQVAGRITKARRESDTVARLGGDEFVVLLEDLDPSVASDLATKLNQTLRVPYLVGAEQVQIGASIGVAIGSADTESSQELIQRADAAMYLAKGEGRNRHRMASR